ncbi:MAG: formylglycine-generating enzyme family protein [Myxococcales bacterium]|nr:formylglycine-generating enzyme family protein [Myxococcales bacterium]
MHVPNAPARLCALSLTLLLASVTTEAAEPAPAGMKAAPCGPETPTLKCIPGGWFTRGHDRAWKKDARPAMRVWQDTFYMDTYEVTSGQYRGCMRAKGCKRAKPLYGDFSRGKQPMVAMSWFDAVDYCRWQGKHLPTEAEWEKAARGPNGDTQSWGNDKATCKRAVIMDKRGRSCGTPKRGTHTDVGRTYVIGTRAPGHYGLFDMNGNAWEWVADWYSKSWTKCGAACQKPNPKGPCDGAAKCRGHRYKLVKGGSWYWPAKYATSYYRRAHRPSNKPISHFGFRCAASLAEAARIRAGDTPAAKNPPPPVRKRRRSRKRRKQRTRRAHAK